MCAGGPSREWPPGGVLEAQRYDALGEDIAPGDREICLEFFYFELWCAFHTSEFAAVTKRTTVTGRDTFIARKGEDERVCEPLRLARVSICAGEAVLALRIERVEKPTSR